MDAKTCFRYVSNWQFPLCKPLSSGLGAGEVEGGRETEGEGEVRRIAAGRVSRQMVGAGREEVWMIGERYTMFSYGRHCGDGGTLLRRPATG